MDCVAKTLFRDPTKRHPLALGDLEREIHFLSTMRHPFVLYLFGACFDDPTCPIVVLERCALTLEERIVQGYNVDPTKHKEMTEKTKLKYALQLAQALEFLQSNQVLHRDLKPSNVFISFEDTVKLADFGLAKQLDTSGENVKMTGETGSYRYMAPEVFSHAPEYSYPADVFSFVMLLYFLFSGVRPFFDIQDGVQCAVVVAKGFRPMLKMIQTDSIRPLLTKGWVGEPERRITIHQIIPELVSLSDQAAQMESKTSDCYIV